MKKIAVKGDNGYNIIISRDLIKDTGVFVRDITKAGKALIITDTNVGPVYGHRVKASLENAGFKTTVFSFPAGEKSKNLATVTDMIEAMCEAELSRNDIVIALGGGVTGDMAGFASAVYLRGIDFVQIPTSLLSQVDSSVGGKTGCDLTFGKNLIGAFHNPRLVLIDIDALKTLPERYFKDGMGEVIKCGCIKSAPLFEKLEKTEDINDILEEVISLCVDIKRQVVENDFTEKGERMLLNFGHTIAHAIEKHYNYERIAHGEAVGIGMVAITRSAERYGLAERGTAEKISALLGKYGLPTKCEVSAEELTDIMLHDKKRRGDSLNLVLVSSVGNSFVHKIENDRLKDFFAEE